MGTEVEEFLAEMLPKQRAADQAYHNGDVHPRLAARAIFSPITCSIASSGTAPGRSTKGVAPTRLKTVDSKPCAVGPPLRISVALSPKSEATCSARVALI